LRERVGFDLYVRMIGEAVNELKGGGPAEKPEARVELPVNAHVRRTTCPVLQLLFLGR
jgi:transcription-repair coupling factor (superfamily II helicase)